MSKLSHTLIFAVGAAAGSAVTYLLTKRVYESRIDEEIESVKETYRSANDSLNRIRDERLAKAEEDRKELEDLTKTYKKILKDNGYIVKHGTEDDIPKMKGYKAYEVGAEDERKEPKVAKVIRMATKEEEESRSITAEEIMRDKLAHYGEDDESERAYEELRESSEKLTYRPRENPPYLITVDEFDELPEYDKLTVTYYSGDMTLTDDKDELMDIESTVGHEALNVLGSDNPCIYVRNDRIAVDYEILWVEAGFAELNGVDAV